MRYGIKAFFISTVLILLISCSVHKDFSYYKEAIMLNPIKKVHLDGIYIIDCKDARTDIDLFCFYTNGLCNAPVFSISLSDRICANHVDGITYYLKRLKEYPKNSDWGVYKVNQDSISFQSFYEFNQSTVIRDMVEFRGVISNDSTILITEMECTWCNRGFMNQKTGPDITKYDPPIQFNFYPYDFKPDSTVAWFKNKRWYKKDLHPSRK